MGLKAGIWASKVRTGPKGWDLDLQVCIWALRGDVGGGEGSSLCSVCVALTLEFICTIILNEIVIKICC